MGAYKGDFDLAMTGPIVFLFSTFDSNDPSASVALSGLAVGDIEIYKNGVATTRASDAGYVLLDTDGIDFDGTVGIGGFSIDIDNDTDSGFFAAGNEYDVILGPITVDGATINFHAGSFSIERELGALAITKLIQTAVIANAAGVDISADILVIDNFVDGLESTIGTAGAGLSDLGGMSTGMKAEVEAEVDDGLIAKGLDHLVFTSVAGADVADDSIIAQMVDDAATADWDGYDNETASLEALNVDIDALPQNKTGYSLSAAGTLAIWHEAVANIVTASTIGKLLKDEITSARMATLTDWINGGRLDLLIDTLITGVVVKTMNVDVNDAVSVDSDVYDEALDHAAGVDTALTLRQHFRLAAAALYGKASGLGTTAAKYRNIPDDVDAISATVDADGNRSVVTLDKT